MGILKQVKDYLKPRKTKALGSTEAMPFNPFSASSSERHMGKSPLDKMQQRATEKYRKKRKIQQVTDKKKKQGQAYKD